MNLSLILLKTGLTLISLTDELEYEPKVHLVNPHVVSGKAKLTLTPWPDYTDDEHILLHSDSLLTICEPTDQVRQAYEKKVKNVAEVLKPTPQPVILTEDENPIDSEDDYEPRYQEI